MIDWLRRPPADPVLELAGRTLPIHLHRNARARRLTLRLARDGTAVRLTLPPWAPSKDAIAFAQAKAAWLEAELAKLPAPRAIEPGGTLTYRGRELRIEWQAGNSRRILADETRVATGGPAENLSARLNRWLEREALRLCEADLAHYCGAAGIAAPPPLRTSRARARWGSCSNNSGVRINWRLVQAPDFVRRSVVAHEVAHLVHFDHSPAFHALLSDIYEGDIGEADGWLKRHGRSLYAAFG